jgi:hypothetical protein
MCGPMAAVMALTAVSTMQKMQTDQAQASYTSKVNENNATSARYAAADAQRRGELDAQRVQRNTSAMVGAQRAGYAAKGLDVSEGTPGDVIDQTNFFGKADAETARYNAKLDAYGKNVQAQNFGSAAGAARYNGSQAVTGDLLSGASSVASSWCMYGGCGAGSTSGKWNGTDFSGK